MTAISAGQMYVCRDSTHSICSLIVPISEMLEEHGDPKGWKCLVLFGDGSTTIGACSKRFLEDACAEMI